MRILIYIKKLDANSTLTFIINDIIGLKKKNDVKIITSQSSNPPNLLKKNTIRFSFDESQTLYKLQHFLAIHNISLWFKGYNLKRRFKDVIKTFKPDLVITHFGDESLLFLQNIKLDTPVLVMFHGYDASAWLRVKKYVNFYKNLFKKPNFFPVTCSENMKFRMGKTGIPMQKAFVVYYGIDTDFFSPTKKPANDIPIFLQVSSFNEKKGHLYTLLAFKKYLENNLNTKFKLILAGEGRLKTDIKNFATKLKLSDYVIFPGWVNREQTKKLLSKADFFIHHSITDNYGNMEGIPNAIIEAMSMGLPIISTYHSGIPELVTNNKNGILINEKDIDNYAKAIKAIKHFNCFSENRIKVKKNFNINKRIEKLYLIIQKITNEKY